MTVLLLDVESHLRICFFIFASISGWALVCLEHCCKFLAWALKVLCRSIQTYLLLSSATNVQQSHLMCLALQSLFKWIDHQITMRP